MSKEKVERYREEKVHRKEYLEKEKQRKKRNKTIGILCGVVILAALAFGIGVTIKNQYDAYQAAKPDYYNASMMVADWSSILEESTESTEGSTDTDANSDETDAADESADATSAEQSDAETGESSDETAEETNQDTETSAAD